MPGDFGKMPKYAKPPNKSYCSMVCQMHKLKVLRQETNFAIHYFIVLTADIFRNSGYRRQLCDGRAAIIKLAALSTLWLESQVNVSNAKSLKMGKGYGFLYGLSYQRVEATISFINRKSI
jgi:Cu(I)/Ag(I) efflux system membrane fusion protein